MKKIFITSIILLAMLTVAVPRVTYGQGEDDGFKPYCDIHTYIIFPNDPGSTYVPANTTVCVTFYFCSGGYTTYCDPGYSSDKPTPFTYDICHDINPANICGMKVEVYYGNGKYYSVYLPCYVSPYGIGMQIVGPGGGTE
jgi:hypothetical protein